MEHEDREVTYNAQPLLDEFTRFLESLSESFDWAKESGDKREAAYWAGCIERWADLGEYMLLILERIGAHKRMPPWPSGPTPRTSGRSVASNTARKAVMRTLRRM